MCVILSVSVRAFVLLCVFVFFPGVLGCVCVWLCLYVFVVLCVLCVTCVCVPLCVFVCLCVSLCALVCLCVSLCDFACGFMCV